MVDGGSAEYMISSNKIAVVEYSKVTIYMKVFSRVVFDAFVTAVPSRFCLFSFQEREVVHANARGDLTFHKGEEPLGNDEKIGDQVSSIKAEILVGRVSLFFN